MLKRFRPVSLILLVGALGFSGNLYATPMPGIPKVDISQQNAKVSGIVEDALGPVTGASVIVKGTTNGTMTDLDGHFTLDNVKKGDIIQISFIGYTSQDIPYTGQSEITVKLVEDTQKLDEVVVTALGMKRDKKALGYAMQELKGDDLLASREPNLANSLSGKVSGLQIVRSSNGVGGSSKIVLRGNNSLTGSNQPLIVVDGTPMDNFTGGVDDVWGNSGADMGNGLSDINPEDIESISVLKDAAATAIWGSQGANGVIEIKTKRGKRGKPRLTYSLRLTGTYQPDGVDLLTGDQYTMLMKEAYFNPRLSDAAADIPEFNYITDKRVFSEWQMFNNNTDWVKEVKQVGLRPESLSFPLPVVVKGNFPYIRWL